MHSVLMGQLVQVRLSSQRVQRLVGLVGDSRLVGQEGVGVGGVLEPLLGRVVDKWLGREPLEKVLQLLGQLGEVGVGDVRRRGVDDGHLSLDGAGNGLLEHVDRRFHFVWW